MGETVVERECGPFTAGRCDVWAEHPEPHDGAAVFAADGQPFLLIGDDLVVGGDALPRAQALAALLNAAPAVPQDVAQRLQDHMEQHHGVCLKASEWDAAVLAALAHQQPSPVPMLLFCPKCGEKHIDEEARPSPLVPEEERWTNPPHKSHLCHGCGTIWRPADVPTEGVAAIATIGSADTIDLNVVASLSPIPPEGEDDVAVTQEDRDAAAEMVKAWCAVDYSIAMRAGQMDESIPVQAFAAHRKAALARAGQGYGRGVREREALEQIGKFVENYYAPWGSWKTAWWEGEVSDDAAFTLDNALKHVANIAGAALAPPQGGEE